MNFILEKNNRLLDQFSFDITFNNAWNHKKEEFESINNYRKGDVKIDQIYFSEIILIKVIFDDLTIDGEKYGPECELLSEGNSELSLDFPGSFNDQKSVDNFVKYFKILYKIEDPNRKNHIFKRINDINKISKTIDVRQGEKNYRTFWNFCQTNFNSWDNFENVLRREINKYYINF